MVAAREYLRSAREITLKAVSEGAKIDPARVETEQRRVHGLAWTATAVESMEQLLAWHLRTIAQGVSDAGESLIVCIGFGNIWPRWWAGCR
jgi:(2S)-methylsuccinyl-CoA dehydrogenase